MRGHLILLVAALVAAILGVVADLASADLLLSTGGWACAALALFFGALVAE